VAQGGCVALMSLMARGARPVWGFDSFEEMPPLQAEDEGDGQAWVGFRCSGPDGLQRARQTLKRYAVDEPTVRLIPGWFEETLPIHLEKLMPIAVLRLDNDWYQSTRFCLENLYDLVAPGGFVLIDDYHTFVGCRKAVDEFRKKRGIDANLITVESGSEAYWRKP
jgi:O-methyltransferase